MPEALPLPIRVLVKGASTVNWVSPMGGPRTDFTFPRVVEQELLAAGRPVELRTISVPSELTSTAVLRWDREVLAFSPDVVVLVYGHYESMHYLLPRWLERHVNSLRTRHRAHTDLYRTRVLRPFWMTLAKLQARLDVRFDSTARTSRPRKVAKDLDTLIGHLQSVGSPLVFVFELLPPASRYRSWFPGMAERISVMNATIEGLVDTLAKDNVRYFRVSPIVDEVAQGDVDLATPDGFHYSPQMHRSVGSALAREIGVWAQTQSHLRQPGVDDAGAGRHGAPTRHRAS